MPLAISGLGMAGLYALLTSGSAAPLSPLQPEAKPPVVDVQELEVTTHRVKVVAHGEVQPARRVILQPEVNGVVVWQSPQLFPGGRIAAGKPVVRVDRRNYALAMTEQRAALEKKLLDLRVERSRGQVALDEWRVFHGERPLPSNDSEAELALRRPHLREKKLEVQAAQSALRRARLELDKTTLRSPFNAIVQEKLVDIGQLISPQTAVATLVSTDEFWVRVDVPLPSLQHIQNDRATKVQVVSVARSRSAIYPARMLGIYADVDNAIHMARILVSVTNPLALDARNKDSAERTALLIGAFVEVTFEGETLQDVFKIPRSALRTGGRIFILNDESRLEIRELDVVWSTSDAVFTSSSVKPRERLVVGRVPTPVSGMALRVRTPEPVEDTPQASAP